MNVILAVNIYLNNMLQQNKIYQTTIICSDQQNSKTFQTIILRITIIQENYREERR